eukprot:2949479-Lingulodinium_polyedra.AAC.1
MKLAFSLQSASLMTTNRYVDARACMVSARLSGQRDLAERRFSETTHVRWAFVQRCWDETPVHLEFGNLAEVLAPYARYVVPPHLRAQFGDRITAPASQLGAFGVKFGRHGIVDLLVQTITAS